MRVRSFVVCAILIAASAQASSAKPAVAPADEYFGRMKLSILGISNIMHDTKLRESFDPTHAAVNFTKLASAEDALEDWAAKYPGDTWLPGKAYYMSHEFWAMNTADGDRAAERCRALLLTRFAKSPYSAKANGEIAAMFQPKIATTVATSPSTSSATTAVTTSSSAVPPATVTTAAPPPPPTIPHS
ncbi:MAG TPA: hypothetical protein VJN22_06635 [Candidatus Eremiobacteraceae bacterium]|nr:hypothetical protein [Candidatus Eremiobacteraceae bacterium]